MSKVAIVTGGNKGIGYAIVKGLAKQFNGAVYLTARNEKLGHEAVENLKKELSPPNANRIRFHHLDVTKNDTVTKFRDYLKKEHGGIDILANNAGIAVVDPSMPLEKQNDINFGVNYFGVKNVSHALFPLLRPHARVVVVASRGGALRGIEDVEVQKKLCDANLTEKEIDATVNQYLNLSKEGKQAEKGYLADPYCTSKIFAIALARIQNRDLQKDVRSDIIVNACCPGMVATDMSAPIRSAQGNLQPGDDLVPGFKVKTLEEGADSILYLCLLPENAPGPKGEFVAERQVLEWETLPTMREMLGSALDGGYGH